MEEVIGGRSRLYDSGGETNASPAGLTLGGILSIKQTPPCRIRDRTLLDLIRDDQTSGNESKKTWKMFREKLLLKLSGSVSTTTGSTLASDAHITADGDRTTTTRLNSPTVNNTSSEPDTQVEDVRREMSMEEPEQHGGGDGGEPAPVRMSLMSLLEVEGSANDINADDEDDDDDDDDDDDEMEVEVTVGKEEVTGGDGGGGYNDCCVCMVRHKGAAFIPCGHTFCRLCSRELFFKRASCPLCNNFILEILDIF